MACGLWLVTSSGCDSGLCLEQVLAPSLLIPDPLVDALSPFEIFQREEISAIHFPLKDQGSGFVIDLRRFT